MARRRKRMAATAHRLTETPISIVRIGAQDPLELHWHEFHELVLIFRGHGVHFTEDEECEITVGDVFLIPPGVMHGYRNTEDVELVNILYLPDQLQLPMLDLADAPGYHAFFELEPRLRREHGLQSCLHVPLEELEHYRRLVDRIEEELSARSAGFRYMAASLLMRLQLLIARSYSVNRPERSEPMYQLGGLLSFIENHYQEDLSLEMMAQHANMSKSTLNRMFRKALNTSPTSHVIQVRIRKAAEMLRLTDNNITDIAYRVGFADSNYFSRQFRQVTGVSPRQYRARL